MKQSFFEIVSNTALTDSVYKMVLAGDTSAITSAGQFVNILRFQHKGSLFWLFLL